MATNAAVQKLLSKEDCEKILKKSLDYPAQLLGYKITKFHDAVVGFMGDHFCLTITACNSTTFRRTYFVKTVPQFNQLQLDYVQKAGIFKKELLLYQNLLPDLLKINHFGPSCYFLKDNCIVLEDLGLKGYKMLSRSDYLDEKYCISIIKTLARFHAASFIYENNTSVKIGENFPEETAEACYCFTDDHPRQKWCVNATACVIDLIKLLPQIEDSQEICDKFYEFVYEEFPTLIKPSRRFSNVLTHDDLWCNNMMFNDESECIFVDFQMVRYAPPALDFLLVLLLNVERRDFNENLDNFVDIYYSTLQDELGKHNLKVSQLLSKTEFVESLEFYKLAALTEAAMYSTHVYISEELTNHIMSDFDRFMEFSLFNRSKFAVKEFQDKAQYRKRLNSVLVPLVEALANH